MVAKVMWFSSFQIQNFKSFQDSDDRTLSRGTNVIVGQNNAGKTALLKAIGDMRESAAPHLDSKLPPDQALNLMSRVTLEVVCEPQEVINAILLNNTSVRIPVSQNWANSNANTVLNHFISLEELRVRAQRAAARGNRFSVEKHHNEPSTKNLISGNNPPVASLRITAEPNQGRLANPILEAKADTIGIFVLQQALTRTYYFDAIRTPKSRCPHGASTRLANNAENLAEVLSKLQSSPTAYKRYLEQVKRVLPLVKHVSVEAVNAELDEILIWNIEESKERKDLAVPLSECGTGIGQVLAIIYVVMHSRGDILVIDEPNSFLHPRATKELMNIFREDANHQYIIATHSTEVVVATQPEKLFMLTIEDEQTKITELQRAEIASARQVLDELGSRLSDVFGVDSVVWVEGQTEVDCFPLLLAARNKRLATGVSFVPLRSTGDLEGKHADVIVDIYRNISNASSLLPKNIAIVLDGDKQGNKRVAEWEKAFGVKVTFLDRRTYENYLLHPRAILVCLNSCATFQSSPLGEISVVEVLNRLGRRTEFGAADHAPFSVEWIKWVNAPKLLDEVFRELSGTKEIYRKLIHSNEITKWILINDQEFLQPVVEQVVAAVGEGAVAL